MFTLLGLSLPVVAEIFQRKKKVIKKNELKMIYYSGLHRQGMPTVDKALLTVHEVQVQRRTWKSYPDLFLRNQACPA